MSEQLVEEDGGIVEGGATTAPSEPSAAAEPGPADELERALAEFDQSMPSPAPAPAAEPPPASVDPLQDQQLDQERVDAGERAFQEGYQRELSLQQERLAFDQECERIQATLPDHIPEGYVKAALLAASIEDPRLEIAWQARNINSAELRAELQRVTVQFMQLRSNPAANPQQIEQLRQWGAQLEVAVNAKAILRQAELRLVNEAKKSKRPIDKTATEDRAAIVAWMTQGASTNKMPEEPPINWGQLSPQEFEAEKRKLGL